MDYVSASMISPPVRKARDIVLPDCGPALLMARCSVGQVTRLHWRKRFGKCSFRCYAGEVAPEVQPCRVQLKPCGSDWLDR